MNVMILSTYSTFTGANQCLIDIVEDLKDDVNFLAINTEESLLNKKLDGLKVDNINIFTYQDVINEKDLKNNKKKMKIPVKKILNFIKEIQLYFLIKNRKIDLIHINSGASSVGYLAGKWSKTKIVWHIREFVLEDHGNYFWNEKKRIKQLNSTDSVIAVSHSVKEKFESLGVKNIKVIYDGVKNEGYKIRKIFNDKIIKLSILGRLSETKGQLEAIDAFEIIRKENYMAELHIYGEGSLDFKEKLERRIDCSAFKSDIYLHDFVDNVSEVWNNTDIALVCSKKEAFGRVTAEAMMSGCLVIGSNSGGTKELLAENRGLLYEQNNFEDLASKIIFALDNKHSMQKRALSGQNYSVNNLTKSKNANFIFAIYKKLVGIQNENI